VADPVLELAAQMADGLMYGAEIQARMMPPSQQQPLPRRLQLEHVCALAIRGELFHSTTVHERKQ